MKCTYVIENLKDTLSDGKFNSYAELFDWVMNTTNDIVDLSTIDDILYSNEYEQSLALDKYNKNIANLKELNNLSYTKYATEEKNDANTTIALCAGEPLLSLNNKAMTPIEFVMTSAANVNGVPLLPRFADRNFVANYKRNYVNSRTKNNPGIQNISDIARNEFEQAFNRLDMIQDDMRELHSLYWRPEIDGSFNKSPNKFMKHATTGSRVHAKINELFEGLNKFLYNEMQEYKDAYILRNVNIVSPITLGGLETGLSLLGHIDYLFISPDGTLHAYVFKTTVLDPRSWKFAEEDLYKQLLAFLKMMLANKGMNVNNMTLDIVPVKLEYESDFSALKSINVYNLLGVYRYSSKANNQYALADLEAYARYFIKDNSVNAYVPTPLIEHANEINRALFPECNIVESGLEQSALLWIMAAPTSGDATTPVIIKQVGDKGHAYDVTILGLTYKIADNRDREDNKEIFDLVNSKLQDLPNNLDYRVGLVRNLVNNAMSTGNRSFRTKSSRFEEARHKFYYIFQKYVPRRNEENKLVSDWEIDYSLIKLNIILFKNKVTRVIDVISMTPFNINASTNFRRGKNLLGCYLPSLLYNSLDGNYGNLEAVRAMTLLNEIAPNFYADNYKFGTLKVLSCIDSGDCFTHNIGEFNKIYYVEIMNWLSKLQPLLKLYNNFAKALFEDPSVALWREYCGISDPDDEAFTLYTPYQGLGLEALAPKNTGGLLFMKLRALLNILENILRRTNGTYGNPEIVRADLNNHNDPQRRQLARLYVDVTRAYLSLRGESVIRKTDWDELRSEFMTSFSHPDENVRYVVDNLLITYDQILLELLEVYDKRMRNSFMKFYKQGGYTSTENMIIGSLRRMYTNLLDPTSNLMAFKDPYDMSNNLNSNERELLKHILYEMYWIRTGGNPEFLENDVNAIREYMANNEDYLWMPLEKASRASMRASVSAWNAGLKNAFRMFKRTATRVMDQLLGQTSEEYALAGNNDLFSSLTLHNPFDTNMRSGDESLYDVKESRKKLIEKYTKPFFEINLERVAYDYLKRSITTTLLNKYLIATKALLLLLNLSANYGGNAETVLKEVDYILRYLKVNVFHRSAMTKRGLAITSFLQPLRRLATMLLIGGNLVGMARDTITGVEQNFLRTVTKLNSDLDPASISAAYAFVTKTATSNAMATNLLSKLAVAYRLAGSDIEAVSQRMLTGRNGILNFENALFSTMRTPDFMNRMVLFIARCMHDGVLDYSGKGAFYIDNDNNLVYDWTKDKRFAIYAAGDEKNPEYKKQKLLYYSMILEYNNSHPDQDKPLLPGDPLKRAYTTAEVRNIQALADNIYGAYDTSKKAMVENMAYGWTFALFFSWMGGIANNYFATPLRSVLGKLSKELDHDENGRPLYFTEDGRITPDPASGLIVLKDVPAIVQGVIPLMQEAAELCRIDGEEAFKKYFGNTPLARAIGLKMVTDVLGWLLLSFLFGGWFDKKYKEYSREDMINNPYLQNIAIELCYRGYTRANDLFKGPLVIYDFFFHGGLLPFISVPTRLISNTIGLFTGTKNWQEVWASMGGYTSSFKNSRKAEWQKRELGL